MEDELSKHTKEIYKTIKSRDHSLGEKFKDIIVEILIIVFAVTLSIWFHNWAEHRHEQNEVKEFLKGLRVDLHKDIELLEKHKTVIVRLDSNFIFIASLDSQTIKRHSDQEINSHLYTSIPVFHPNVGRYEGFKSSGKIGTIENDSLKENILTYYQQTLPEFAYSENYINSLQLKILDDQLEKNDKTPIRDFLQTGKMKSLFRIGVHNFANSIVDYDRAIGKAKEIIAQIDEEIKE